MKRLPGPPDLSAAQMGAAGPATCGRQGDADRRDAAPRRLRHRPGARARRRGARLGDGRPREDRSARTPGWWRGAPRPSRTASSGTGWPRPRSTSPASARRPGTPTSGCSGSRLSPRACARRRGAVPDFASGGGAGRLVTLSSAVYPAFGDRPASLEPALATGELRGRLGFQGVSMTDALETVEAFGEPGQTAVMAAHAGADLLMFTSTPTPRPRWSPCGTCSASRAGASASRSR